MVLDYKVARNITSSPNRFSYTMGMVLCLESCVLAVRDHESLELKLYLHNYMIEGYPIIS